MIVASLVDAGADADALKQRLAALNVAGYALAIARVTKSGFAATRFHVNLTDSGGQPHRHLSDITKTIESADLSGSVTAQALRVFQRLAEAEAAVHGCSVEQVHFHEVGAVDAIVDIVGAFIALELLGVDRVVCSAIPTGSGTVRCEHGIIPVPAPATIELLRGVPLADCDETGELITPTAAAVLTTVARSFGPLPAMKVSSIGYGAGTREGQSRPNLLRVIIGEEINDRDGDADDVTVLETNLDDATPEVVGYALERLLAEGALDAFAMPIQMKKSRCGMLLSVICTPDLADHLENVVFAETPTFGIRRRTERRVKLRRGHEMVTTSFGDIRIKVGRRGDLTTASPEFDDCKAAAATAGVALREVMAEAARAWAKRCDK